MACTVMHCRLFDMYFESWKWLSRWIIGYYDLEFKVVDQYSMACVVFCTCWIKHNPNTNNPIHLLASTEGTHIQAWKCMCKSKTTFPSKFASPKQFILYVSMHLSCHTVYNLLVCTCSWWCLSMLHTLSRFASTSTRFCNFYNDVDPAIS